MAHELTKLKKGTRYAYGSYQFSAVSDEHARRMVECHLAECAKKDKPFQEDPYTPQMREKLELGPFVPESEKPKAKPKRKAKAKAKP